MRAHGYFAGAPQKSERRERRRKVAVAGGRLSWAAGPFPHRRLAVVQRDHDPRQPAARLHLVPPNPVPGVAEEPRVENQLHRLALGEPGRGEEEWKVVRENTSQSRLWSQEQRKPHPGALVCISKLLEAQVTGASRLGRGVQGSAPRRAPSPGQSGAQQTARNPARETQRESKHRASDPSLFPLPHLPAPPQRRKEKTAAPAPARARLGRPRGENEHPVPRLAPPERVHVLQPRGGAGADVPREAGRRGRVEAQDEVVGVDLRSEGAHESCAGWLGA